MTYLGTRPPTVDEWEKYELHHRSRMSTKPGITGMWQVSGRSDITDFEEVVRLDTEYIQKVEEVPQRETTPFHPYSPYAVAKQYGFWMVKEYRDAYGMFAVNGILFNHESERRGENFVTRKITLAAGRIAEGLQDHLELGNMDSLRDWGYAIRRCLNFWIM